MELSINLQNRFESIDEEIEIYFEEGNYKKIIQFELEKWKLLPEPKMVYEESFHIAKSLVGGYLVEKDYVNSKKWSEILFKCDLERIDDGEREFVAGRSFYESGDKEQALETFKIAFLKSKGRAFVNEDPKYLDFYKNPDNYLEGKKMDELTDELYDAIMDKLDQGDEAAESLNFTTAINQYRSGLGKLPEPATD